MGLSYLSNTCLNTELPQDVLGLDYLFQDDFTFSDTSIDSLFQIPQHQQPQPTFVSQNNQLEPTTTHYGSNSSQLFGDSKRQKTCHYQDDVTHFTAFDDMLLPAADAFFEGCCYGGGGEGNGDTTTTTQMLPVPGHGGGVVPFAPVFACGAASDHQRSGRRGALSPQSIAARQRRRKIADKTQELGKLIPGGHRMNTAEMFQSAAMYVKFLQAQIAMLTLSNSIHVSSEDQNGCNCYDDDDDDQQRVLELLAGSLAMQEKLYNQEKCLVPKKLVEALSSDPAVGKQVNNLMMR